MKNILEKVARNFSTNVRQFAALMIIGIFLSGSLAAQKTFDSSDLRANRPFDFTDFYYFQNGINPNFIVNRRSGNDGLSIFDVPPTSINNNVRVKITIPAYDHSGNPVFWYLLGEILQNGFTSDNLGANARVIADKYKIYVFPSRTGNPLQLGNNRQADLVDLRNGYFSNDPLGLWQIVFVNYTAAANTPAGQKRLRQLAEKNGLSLDGTPIIRAIGEIDDLTRQNLVTQQVRKVDGSEGPTWSLCPVIKDPRNGAIAADAFLANVRRGDGLPLGAEQNFLDQFNCLKNTGDYCGSR